MTTVYLVIKDHPFIYNEIERIFTSEEKAADYILDTYPYFIYFDKEDIFGMPDLKDDMEHGERYYILERPVFD